MLQPSNPQRGVLEFCGAQLWSELVQVCCSGSADVVDMEPIELGLLGYLNVPSPPASWRQVDGVFTGYNRSQAVVRGDGHGWSRCPGSSLGWS
jgi:hypothetical protein